MEEVRDATLRARLDELDDLRVGARSLVEDLSPAQFNWRPSSSGWSIGQCLEHVTKTSRLYSARVDDMIAEARDRAGRGEAPYREGAFSRWFIRSMEPPPGLRVRTWRKVEPAADLDRDDVAAAFDAELDALADHIRAADGVSLRHGRTRSPFLPILRFTLGQVFALNLAHGRRHLWQARRVRERPGFPAA